MINKKAAKDEQGHKIKIFQYEVKKIKKLLPKIFVIGLVTQTTAFLFFLFIGKYEEHGKLFSSFIGLISLSTTLTICILSIVGAVFIRKLIVHLYIGNQRARMFLFPIKRSQLFLTKNVSFFLIFLLGSIFSLIVSFIFELLLYAIFNDPQSLSMIVFVHSILIKITCCLLLCSIITLSEIVAVRMQSETVTIITAVINIIGVSNIVVLGALNYTILTFILSVFIALIIGMTLITFTQRIEKTEIL